MTMLDDVPVEYVRERLLYDAETGKLFWLHHPRMSKQFNTTFAGKEAFTAIRNTGYRHGRINNRAYQAHRVAWALYHGEWPDGEIDHINHDRTDNRITNLRAVSHQENHRNTSLRRNNSSGSSGVSWFNAGSKWSAYIVVDGRKLHLGYFNGLDDAVSTRKAAERQYGFHENHGKEVA